MKLDNAGRVTGQSISGSIWQHCSRAGTGKEARAQAESIDASGPQILIQISAAGNMGNLRQVTLSHLVATGTFFLPRDSPPNPLVQV
jgi:hypothetical protein